MGRITVRLSEATSAQVERAAKERGFASTAAFARAAIEAQLRSGSTDELAAMEQRMAQTLDRLLREFRGLHTGQQGTFACLDALVRVFFQCVPEPPAEVRDAVRAKAGARYENFLRNVARSISGGQTREALRGLGDNAEDHAEAGR